MFKKFMNSLLWIWQFPQHLLAILLEGILCISVKRIKETDKNVIINCPYFAGSMSLGKYLFMRDPEDKHSLKHEMGHSKQSLYLGPLYLLVIGIPSFIHCIVYSICGYFGLHWDYYKFYSEKWANKLAGLE